VQPPYPPAPSLYALAASTLTHLLALSTLDEEYAVVPDAGFTSKELVQAVLALHLAPPQSPGPICPLNHYHCNRVPFRALDGGILC